jgi:nicotinamidase-related amidase
MAVVPRRFVMGTCLMVVDVQRGFVSDKTEHVVPRIKDLLGKNLFDVVVFTKFVNELGSPYRRFLHWNALSTAREQEIVAELLPFAQNVITKDIYSGLTKETQEILQRNNVDIVYVLGIDTDCCVLKTAADLFEQNIRPVVLEHYSASNGGMESHSSALKVLERLIGRNSILYGPVESLPVLGE